jgi:glutathione S-transferase
MTKLKIFGVPGSRAMRTYWMAHELGLDFEAAPIHFAKPETKTEAFLKVNPNARIPAIDDGEVQLWESMAINLYLARKHGGPLQPTSIADHARAEQWSFWVMTEIEKPLLEALFHRAFLPEAQRDPAKADAAEASLKRPFDVLDAHLADRAYLLGAAFTVADLNVASVLAWTRMAKIDLAAWPKLAAWFANCLSRPAFAKTMAMPQNG